MSTNTDTGSPRSKVVHLPQEVMDLIIDALLPDYFPVSPTASRSSSSDSMTLAQCLLVSRSFYSKARPLVFRSIVWREQVLPCERWHDERDRLFFDLFRVRGEHEHTLPLFAKSLTTHVRSLLLIICFPSTARMVTFDGWSLPQSELDARREAFPALLEQMVNIDEFALEPSQEQSYFQGQANTPTSTSNTEKRMLNWKALLNWNQSLKNAIRRVCRRARILRFENITGLPLSLLGASENLKTLSVSSINFVAEDLGPKKSVGLEELQYLSTNQVSSDLFMTILERRPEAFSKLNRLRITLPSESTQSERYVSGERAVLHACASSLKMLEIYSPTACQFSYPADSVSHLTALHTLTLQSTISTATLLPESLPPDMMSFFITDLVSASGSVYGSLSPSSIIELNLELYLEGQKIGINLKDRVQIVPQEWERRWARLDTVIAGPAFPLLERLNISFVERLKLQSEKEQNMKMIIDEEHVKVRGDLKAVKDNANDDSDRNSKMDSVDWITTLEETSLDWLKRYIGGALPTVSNSSQVVIKLEYRIFTNEDQFRSWKS